MPKVIQYTLALCSLFLTSVYALKTVNPIGPNNDVSRLHLAIADFTYLGVDKSGTYCDVKFDTASAGEVDFNIGHSTWLEVAHTMSIRFPGGPDSTSDTDWAYEEFETGDTTLDWAESSERRTPSFNNTSGYTHVYAKLIVQVSAQADSPSGSGYLEYETSEEQCWL